MVSSDFIKRICTFVSVMRQKWFVIAILLLLAIPAQAQWFIGGRVSANLNIKEQSAGFTLRPDFGYTFKNDIAVGLNVVIDYYGFTRKADENRATSLTYGLAPYIQYYFVRLGRFSFYLDGGLEVSRYTSPDTTYWRFIPYISPGLGIVLTDHWSFLGTLGRLDYDSYINSISFSLDGGGFSAGLYYTF